MRKCSGANREVVEEACKKYNSEKRAGVSRPFRIVFVCLGNICRSPAAEAIMKQLATEKLGDGVLEIDSCGFGGSEVEKFYKSGRNFHDGEGADDRMKSEGFRRGLNMTTLQSTLLSRQHAEEFDLIVAMSPSIEKRIIEATSYWEKHNPKLGKGGRASVEAVRQKTILLRPLSPSRPGKEVPDPYYDGQGAFADVFDLVQECCTVLLDIIHEAVFSSA